MRRAFASLATFAAVAASVPIASVAQDSVIRSYVYDSAGSASLEYADDTCPWECQVVVIECSAVRTTIWFVNVRNDDLAHWLEESGEGLGASLRVNQNRTELMFDELVLADSTGEWWVGYVVPDAAVAAMMQATEVALETPSFTIALPSEEIDRDNVADFVDACSGLN